MKPLWKNQAFKGIVKIKLTKVRHWYQSIRLRLGCGRVGYKIIMNYVHPSSCRRQKTIQQQPVVAFDVTSCTQSRRLYRVATKILPSTDIRNVGDVFLSPSKSTRKIKILKTKIFAWQRRYELIRSLQMPAKIRQWSWRCCFMYYGDNWNVAKDTLLKMEMLVTTFATYGWSVMWV
jgi:hypothetical protein